MRPLVYRDADFEHGLRCCRCDHLFSDGERFEQVFDAMLEDGVPILLLVCPDCVGRPEAGE